MARRPLPPLEGKKLQRMRWLVILWAIVTALNVANAIIDFSWLRAVLAVLFFGITLTWAYEIRRRTDPERTAGWGRAG